VLSRLGPNRVQADRDCLIVRTEVLRNLLILLLGWVAERFKAPVLKTGVGASSPWVRIPPHPPHAAQPNL
jgi:hypothetical protein